MIGILLNERYRLDTELGRGGMGVVYRAHDTVLDRDVAVKVLSASGLGTEGRGRLLREAQAAAGLNHPNVVSVYDAGEARVPGRAEDEGPMPYVVMELVEGTSLHVRRPESLEETVAVAGQVCAALEHAHGRGIVHRDLKPENVLLVLDPEGGEQGMAKLVDFGLARSVASRLSSEGAMVGTVFYLAPELALGQDYDGRADLYALGVMLYELTTGRLPFMADDPVAVISQHLHAPPVPPRARDEGIPPGLDALILRLLSKDPQERPTSASQVKRSLEAAEILDREAVPARELSVLERIERGRLVARERELTEARAIWRKASAGEGGMLLVSGEPGIGKTRLVRELCTEVQVAGDRVLVGECYAESGAPYAPFAQILRRAFRDGAGEELASLLPEFVLADLLTLAPSLRLRFPDVPPNPALDPKSEQQRLFENVVACCHSLSERAPLLLVLEDAHWADSGSLALLRHLARRTRRHRVLIVATYREVELDQTLPFQEVLLDLNRERLATRLRLTRLGWEGTHDMLAALFAEEEITSEFLEGIYRETEGNPFFVEEVCKALVESGQVYYSGGTWGRLEMEELEIPQGVRVAIQSRVGKLPPDCQEMLRLAAVLGREFEFHTLLAASDPSPLQRGSGQAGSGQAPDEDGLIEALESAERAQLVAELSSEAGGTFGFTHALIPATLTEGMSGLRRRRLHRRVAAIIEGLHPDDYEALAYHYSEAADDERALGYHKQAGARALAAYANVEAEGHYRAALELVQEESERADLLWELGRALNRQSRYEEATGVWQEGIAAYRDLEDQDGMARLYARSARAAGDSDIPRGLALCREGMAAVAGAPESPDLAELLHETARAYHFNGLSHEAAPLCRRALEMAERLGAVRVQAEVLATLGVLPSLPYEESIAVLSRAVELSESAVLLGQAARAHNNLALLLLDPEASREHVLRAAELQRQRGEIRGELFHRVVAAFSSLSLGDLAAVETALPSLRKLLDATEKPGRAALRLRWLEVGLLWYKGELTEAITGMRSLRTEAREAGDLDALAWLDTSLALVCIWDEAGEKKEIESILQEALDLCEQGQKTGVSARSLQSVQRARQGEPAEARRLLTAAHKQAAELGELAVWEPDLSWAEANLALAKGQWAEALAAFEATVITLGRTNLRWRQARTLIDWAEAHLARGESRDRERALELLREAEAEFEAMGAHGYVERVRARLEELSAGSAIA